MSDQHTDLVFIALPEGTHVTWLSVAEIAARHGWLTCVPVDAFPTRRRPLTGWITRWSSRHLLQATRRHWAVTHATGGRIARLDLNRLVADARRDAADRWWTWNCQAARHTPKAQTWEHFRAQSDRNPVRLPLAEARTRFEAQPRVLAMLAYNTYPTARHTLPIDDLAAFQAGEAVYVALHWHHALTGDALLTPDRRLLRAASPALADVLRYHADAARVIASLAPTQHLIAVKASTAP